MMPGGLSYSLSGSAEWRSLDTGTTLFLQIIFLPSEKNIRGYGPDLKNTRYAEYVRHSSVIAQRISGEGLPA